MYVCDDVRVCTEKGRRLLLLIYILRTSMILILSSLAGVDKNKKRFKRTVVILKTKANSTHKSISTHCIIMIIIRLTIIYMWLVEVKGQGMDLLYRIILI